MPGVITQTMETKHLLNQSSC